MLKLTLVLLFVSSQAFGVPENSVYPNSGSTDAKIDQQTGISEFSKSPIPQSTGAAIRQEMQERPKKDPTDFQVGPYDKDGNYHFLKPKE